MIRTQGDLMYLLGVDSPNGIATKVQRNTSTPTWVAIKKDGITIGPLLDSAKENLDSEVSLTYPFEEEEWGSAVKGVEQHAYKFKAASEKPARRLTQAIFTDLVDRPLDSCIDCGRALFRKRIVCDNCASSGARDPLRDI